MSIANTCPRANKLKKKDVVMEPEEPNDIDDPLAQSRTPNAKKPRTDLFRLVSEEWTPRDVDAFLHLVDCDWDAPLTDIDEHMIFRPTHMVKSKVLADGTERPMYRIGTWYYDARRISSILFNGEDLCMTAADKTTGGRELRMLCGQRFCIHPRHMEGIDREKRKKKTNK